MPYLKSICITSAVLAFIGAACSAAFAQQTETGKITRIDRTSNTMSLIMVLDQLGMMHHHKLVAPATRHIVPPHTAAVMIERTRNRKWVVDPWTHNSGERPDITPLEVWVNLD